MSHRPGTALIGCGQWGRNHARTLAELGALAAVGDADAQAARAVGQAHGVKVMGVEAMLADARIDALVLALPAEHNCALALSALAAGKHVFVEKPIALTSADAARMVDAARAADRVLMTGHILCYHNAFRALLDCVAAGEIGELRHIQSHRLCFGKFYDRFDALWDLAPHDLSLILGLLGAAPDHVEIGQASVTDGQGDIAQIALGFAGGPTAQVLVSRHSAYDERRFVVTGDRASAIWDDRADWPRKLALVPHRAAREGHGNWRWHRGEPAFRPVAPGMALTDELAHFLDCAAGRAEPLTPGSQGLEVVRILERARQWASSRVT